MEDWKDIAKEENQAYEVRFVPLFLMDWEVLMFNVLLKKFNTNFYQGRKYILWA
jgi:hypothetical protein